MDAKPPSEPGLDAASTPPLRSEVAAAARPSRGPDVLWSAGLVAAVGGIFVATFASGWAVRIVGIAGALLGVAAFVSKLRRQRVSLGALTTVLASLFTAIVGGRPATPPTIALENAPKYVEDESGAEVPADGIRLGGGSGVRERLFRPGPIALSGAGLSPLAPGALRAGALVAAEWDGAWFAGRVLSTGAGSARVHFVGWEEEWDQELPATGLRALNEELLPKPPDTATDVLGAPTPTPNALTIALYQPDALGAETNLAALTPQLTLYSPRLDVSEVPLEKAIPGFAGKAGKPFALSAVGAFRVERAGPHYFAATSDGATALWIDDEPVAPESPIELDAGVHRLRLELRHRGGPRLTANLRAGNDPKALRVLDMNRQGVAQVAREPDGRTRLVLSEGVLFDLDKDELKPSAERALSSIFTLGIAPFPGAAVSIEGHTDDRGSEEHNLNLSRRRAERVRGWLVARGRPDSTLGVQPFGESRPRVPNDSEAHRARNRRVELVIGTASAATQTPSTTATAQANANASPDQPVLDALSAYYRELNDGTFDANRYFEPNVERYITMMNTSTADMNRYIRDVFPKQFKEHHFELEEGSLSKEAPGQYVYVERSRYILAGKRTSVEKRVQVRVRLSPGGKLVFLHQFRKL